MTRVNESREYPRVGSLRPLTPFFRILLWTILCSIPAVNAAEREQRINLRKGWNSVFLEVEPAVRKPAELFNATPIDMVAGFFPQTRPAAYVRNPGDAPWREEGWGVWYAPNRPDAVVTSLYAVNGNQAYLIHSTEDFVWSVSGGVSLKAIQWQPESYNFVGFQVDPAAPPTFETFFATSRAHRGQTIYKLVNGTWAPVREPALEKVQSGAAYWVYCASGSDYQGPMRVRISGSELQLGNSTSAGRIELVNGSGQASRIVIEPLPGDDLLRLVYVDKDLTTLSTTYPALPARLELPELPAGGSRTLLLTAARQDLAQPKSTLLRISNGEGAQMWLSVVAEGSR